MTKSSPSTISDADSPSRDDVLKRMLKMKPKPHGVGSAPKLSGKKKTPKKAKAAKKA